MLVPFLKETISMAITYLFGSTGETIIEKGGNLIRFRFEQKADEPVNNN